MAPTPVEIQLQKSLDILVYAQFDGMSDEAREELNNTITGIKDEYAEAVARAADKTKTLEERKYYTAVGDVIAKSVPAITKGALSAAAAFKKGDSITGSAAIMDIAASIVPVLTTILGATGPEGAIVGALFSFVAQILGFYAPPQPSLTEQFKKILDNVEANDRLAAMSGVRTSVNIYTANLKRTRKQITEILGGVYFEDPSNNNDPRGKKINEMKLSDDNAPNIIAALKAVELGVTDAQGQLHAPAFEHWKVGGWLEIEDNQGNEKWPEVLSVWCRAYSDLMTANLIVHCLANPKEYQEFIKLLDPRNDKSPIRDKVIRNDVYVAAAEHLGGTLKFLRPKFDSWNHEALRILNKITPAARNRGLYLHIGSDGYLYANTTRSSGWSSLDEFEGYGRNFSITVPGADLDSFTPQYHAFVCQHYAKYSAITAGAFGVSLKVSEKQAIGDSIEPTLSDVWALPWPKNTTGYDPKGFFVYLANDGGPSYGYVTLRKFVDGKQWSDGNWAPVSKAGMMNYRAVTHPGAALLDDPDKDGLPPGSPLLGGVDHYNSIHYAALRSSPDVYVNAYNEPRYVPSPWPTYNGIEVDPYYLWVFRRDGFACATHASIVKCINDKSTTPRPPRWMGQGVPVGDEIPAINGAAVYVVNGEKTPKRPRDPFGLISFCPCIDGTIEARIEKVTVTRDKDWKDVLFVVKYDTEAYTADYRIDVRNGTVSLDPWVRRTIGDLYHPRKIPIPCWPLFAQLKKELQLSHI